MKKLSFTNFLTLLSVIAGIFATPSFSSLSSAQSRRIASQEKKFLDLTIGVDHFEGLTFLNENPNFRGDFRNLVEVAYAADTKQMRITPKKTGNVVLTVQNDKGQIIAEYNITVKKSNLNRIARDITALLGEIEGIQIRVINNKVVVDGEVLFPQDINRIFSVVTQYGEQASSIVRLSPIAQKKIAGFIERDVNNPEIHVRAVNETFILEGVANDPDERNRAEIIAKTYVPDIVSKSAPGVRKVARAPVVNLITLRSAPPPEPEKIIQLVVHYVELQKDYTSGFRFQWTPDIGDDTQMKFESGSRTPGSIISSITGTVSNLLPKLNWAKQHGHARVLQSTSVIVQNGQRGTISSMTGIPYQIVNDKGQPSTAFQQAGINADIKPQIVSANSDSIQLVITFKLSALLGITDQGPIVSSNDINTVITVRSGQSAAVGGLVSNTSGTGYNKLPKNVSNNPLFSLYASKDFRRNQSQFVVFITPVIKSSASAGAEQIKKKFRMRE